MNFNTHYSLEGKHAFLSASKWRWINYDDEHLIDAYSRFGAAALGTRLHDFARQCIELNQRLPRSKKTLNRYVNDAISFRMRPEQVLYYSEYCFGTADAISFRDNTLRIHDLKTGTIPAHLEQLMIYAAIFCLEYHKDPNKIHIVLRIYQNDDVVELEPEASDIEAIMTKIIRFNDILRKTDSIEEDSNGFGN